MYLMDSTYIYQMKKLKITWIAISFAFGSMLIVDITDAKCLKNLKAYIAFESIAKSGLARLIQFNMSSFGETRCSLI